LVKLAKKNLKHQFKIISLSRLKRKLKTNFDKKIGFTNGCFDILHKGHLHLFKFCKKNCDILIVAINSDISIRNLKGEKRPYNNLKTRLTNLSKMPEIDYIIYFHKLDPLSLIKKIKPIILFKGSDYNIDSVIGNKFLESYGGKTVLAPYIQGLSTTNILRKKKHT